MFIGLIQTNYTGQLMCKSTNLNDQVAPAPNKQQKHPLRGTTVVTYLRDQNKHMSVPLTDARTHREKHGRAPDTTTTHWTSSGRHEHTTMFTLLLLCTVRQGAHSTRHGGGTDDTDTVLAAGGGASARTLPHARAPHPLIVINWRAGSPAARVMPPLLSPHFV